MSDWIGEAYRTQGWNSCLEAIRGSLRELAEGHRSGGDTVIFELVHKIVARASKAHSWEPLSGLETIRISDDMLCGLCGKGKDDPIHKAEAYANT